MPGLALNSEPPLVLHVIHHLAMGGMENGLVNLINHMPAEAYRHAVVCVEDFTEFRDRIARPGVEVFALHRSKIGAGALRREIFRLCRRLRPALVHTRNMSGLDALLPALLANVPIRVHSEHGWDVDNLDGRQWRPALLRRLHSPLVHRYIAVSCDLQRFLVERIGVRAGRITQIYNGVDAQRFAPSRDRPDDEALPPAFRGPGLVRIGTVGRIQAVKDQATLLRAFASVLASNRGLRATARLAVLGSGPLLSDLRELARSLGIEDLVWLPGASNRVPDMLRAMDVFVLPSLNEGISNTILEAMATGLPVLATRVGGNIELVGEGVTGHLFDPGDIPALARRLEMYLSNPDLRALHGQAARQSALEQFSLEGMVARYRAVYDSLLQETRSRG